MRTKVLGLGLCATSLWFAGAALVMPSASWADTPSYPGCTTTSCTPPSSGSNGGTTAPAGQVVFTPTEPVTSASSALPFTGADIEQMTAVGGTALVLGSVLVARRRRRARA
jgi:LPXTG-motif cell wall-anchored protein